MVESRLHRAIKEYAALKLKERNFDVKFEYPVHNKKVDVAGFKEDKRVAVEVGKTTPEKLEFLSKFFDEVYVISYKDALLNFEEILCSLMDEIEKLKSELTKYKRIVTEAYIRAFYKMVGKVENQG